MKKLSSTSAIAIHQNSNFIITICIWDNLIKNIADFLSSTLEYKLGKKVYTT